MLIRLCIPVIARPCQGYLQLSRRKAGHATPEADGAMQDRTCWARQWQLWRPLLSSSRAQIRPTQQVWSPTHGTCMRE